ncbi:MAG: hypothetical protein K2K84_06465, partial [Muribaculaceae bacterium]|nr:hypothetical protein [Muribaculaceae bacterium]
LSYPIPEGFLSRLVLTVKVNGGRTNISWSTDHGPYVLKIEGQKSSEIDDIHGAEYRLTLSDSVGNHILEKRITPNETSSFPVRLTFDKKGRLQVTTASQKTVFLLEQTGSPNPGSDIRIVTDGPNTLTYQNCNFDYIPAPEIFDGQPAVDENGFGGIWSYLDGVTPKNGSVLIGGKYQLEILPDPDNSGDYIAVYRDGAAIGSQAWEDGTIKARLRPTHFEGHFDVEWYDANRETINDEVTATFQGDNILTIEFPVLETTIRFSRPLSE